MAYPIKKRLFCSLTRTLRCNNWNSTVRTATITASIFNPKILPSYSYTSYKHCNAIFSPAQTIHSSRHISRSPITKIKMGIPSDITLYTSSTPNGIKISILLEELGLDYKLHAITLDDNEQKQPWFVAINPNGRIPAITDKLSDGTPISIFESGAVMQYLVERYDTEHKLSYPSGSKEHWEVTSWLHWQMGGLGPMQGQANHFKRYAPETIHYGINRYTNETRRLYRVLDTQLAKSKAQGHTFLVGDRVTIADIASWTWVASHTWAGIRSLDDFPHLNAWLTELLKRPGFERGRHVPKPHTAFENDSLTDEQLDAKAKGLSAWVQQTMVDAAKEGAGAGAGAKAKV